MDALRGPALVPGDRVRLVSPASFPDWDAINGYVAHLESWGLVPELGEHIMDQLGFMAGPDEDRLADLHAAFRDPGVRAVVTAHGGAGAYRIADRLDFDAIRRDPKPLVGFSDITALHLSLAAHGIASVHGMLCVPASGTAAVRVAGVATGVLVGGHLPTVLNAVGAGLPSLAGAILLVDDNLTNGIAGLDRALAHLRRSRALDGVAGIAVGHIVGGGSDGREPEPDGWSLVDVLEQHLGGLGVPVLGGLPFGHVPDQLNVPLGTTATLDADAGTLTVTAAVR